MSQHTPDTPPTPEAAPQFEVSAYTLQTTNVQVSDPLIGAVADQHGVPSGARLIQLLAILPPGLLAEEKMSALFTPVGARKNPLDAALVRNPALEIVVRVDKLTPEAREALHAHAAGAQAAEGAPEGRVLPPMPDLLGAREG
jgi:hypothetical protein